MNEILPELIRFEEVTPDIGTNVDEVASHKQQDVGFGGMVQAGDGESDEAPDDRYQVDDSVA